jgi:hypothetical protein
VCGRVCVLWTHNVAALGRASLPSICAGEGLVGQD